VRSGQFSRDVVPYGGSLSVVKPDNNDPGSYIDVELLSPSLALNESQQNDLQSRIDDLYNMLRGERDWYR
jgi:hypothetical protein